MPISSPLGVRYLPGETLWGSEEPNFEVAPNHIWVATGRSTPSGPVDMYEYKVVHVNTLNVEKKMKPETKKALTIAGAVAAAWWVLG